MKTRAAVCWILSFSGFALTAVLAREASARACSVASDCPKGFDCEPGGVASDGGAVGICTSLPCQSDSDCGTGFTCFPSGGPGPGVNVPTACAQTAADGGSCGTCVPQWDAPCTADADCGPGYSCAPSAAKFYDCGKDQDASYPAYDTVATVSCSAVPDPLSTFGDAGPPSFPGFPALHPLCDAGSTCTEVTWRACVAQQTGACTVDSDCPSTWTCGCQVTCSDVMLPPPGTPVVEAGCAMACVPPNSDFVVEICGGAEAPPVGIDGGSSSAPPPGASDGGGDAAGPSGSTADGGPSSPHGGGCQVGSQGTEASWIAMAAGLLAWARWRPRTRRRVTRSEAP